MSYDVWLTIDTGGKEPATVVECGNMTSNVAPAWHAAGANVASFDGKLAGRCLSQVTWALDNLTERPEDFAGTIQGNGSWGSIQDAIEYLTKLRDAFRTHPKCTVCVSH